LINAMGATVPMKEGLRPGAQSTGSGIASSARSVWDVENRSAAMKILTGSPIVLTAGGSFFPRPSLPKNSMGKGSLTQGRGGISCKGCPSEYRRITSFWQMLICFEQWDLLLKRPLPHNGGRRPGRRS